MAAVFDSEDLLDMVLDIMTTGSALNAKIAAVEAEKAAKGKGLSASYPLLSVASTSYHLQSWNEKILAKTPAIFYGIEDVVVNPSGGNVNAKTYKVFIECLLIDSGMTNDVSKRIHRYSRALEELFAANFKPAAEAGTVLIEQVRPMSFKLQVNSNDEVRIGGISLSVTIV